MILPARSARSARRIRRTGAALLAGTVVVTLAGGCTGDDAASRSPTRSSTASSSPSPTEEPYGALPTFLPTLTPEAHQIVDASARHPALASQGDQVRVRLAEGSVLASVTGPQTPGQGLVPQPNSTYATWTVRLTDATAPIPLGYRQFVALDQQGRVFRPGPVPSAPALPATLRPGQDLTFQLQVLMSTGEGVMRWSPDGGLAPVQWDFEVEVD